MGLVHAEKMLRCDADLFGHPAAVLRNLGRIVFRAEAAIEALIDAVGHAALAREESVAQAGDGREQRRSQRHGSSALLSCSSANPASAVRLGSETASTLNIAPIPPRPPPPSRFSALEMSSETSREALAISATARASMPSRVKKSPCGTGPWARAPISSASRTSAWKSP